MKDILGVYPSPRPHWVGDGFPVRTLFSYQSLGPQISPFLLLDYAGPAEFAPAARPRGVGVHPHRGFETVTIVYQGEVDHRDSTGQGGHIGPGDVQWMTAAAGILHEEFHSAAFTQQGGTLEMVQLWVNLRARDKMKPPGYQSIVAADIPSVSLPDGAGAVRVIAGEFLGQPGPAHTFTPMNVWDLRLRAGAATQLDLPAGQTAAVIVLRGALRVNGTQAARAGQFVVFDRAGERIAIEADDEAMLLVLTGEPIDEPIVGHGPFVMNTTDEIRQALIDFERGRFGEMSH
jgi:hypothetical protein